MQRRLFTETKKLTFLRYALFTLLFSLSFFFFLLFSFSTKNVPGLSLLIVLTSSTVSARWAVKQTPISPLLTKSIRCSFPASFSLFLDRNANARWQNWLLRMKLFCDSNHPLRLVDDIFDEETSSSTTWNSPSLVTLRW